MADEEELSVLDRYLLAAVEHNDDAAVQQAIQFGANVNCVHYYYSFFGRKETETPLMVACKGGFDAIVRILLYAHADARQKIRSCFETKKIKHEGLSVILYACLKAPFSTIQILFDHDNDLLEIADNDGCTPLFFAIARQEIEIVRFLLKKGANVHATDNLGTTMLIQACGEGAGNLEIVQLLVNAGVDLEVGEGHEGTALHVALMHEHPEVVEFLIANEANAHATNVEGKTTLMYACDDVDLDLEIVELLRNAGVGLEDVDEHGATALHYAVVRNRVDVVQFLFREGANAHATLQNGRTLLMTACENDDMDLEIVQLLVGAGVDLEAGDGHEGTALRFALENGLGHVVEFLLRKGANVNATMDSGATLLMIVSRNASGIDDGGIAFAQMLLKAGANVNARDEFQQTALHFAFDWPFGSTEVARELLEHGADIFAVDSNGRTPFDYPLCCDRSDAVGNELLAMYGSKLTQDHDRLALHHLLGSAEYSFTEDNEFHPPLDPFRIVVPLGKLTLPHLRTVLHSINTDLMIRNRDDTGKLPIHIACQKNAPVEVMALFLERDPTTLHIADNTGNLPLHECCRGIVDDSTVRFLVEQGDDGTLAARNHQGALPLHNLCGSTNPSLRTVQYLIQSFPGLMESRTNAGEYPFMIAAACKSSTLSSLSVVYELVRANPNLVVPR